MCGALGDPLGDLVQPLDPVAEGRLAGDEAEESQALGQFLGSREFRALLRPHHERGLQAGEVPGLARRMRANPRVLAFSETVR